MKYRLILSFLVVVLFCSCYEREEACLDLLAQNYTITADDPCDDCCTYPTVQLRVIPMVGDSIYNVDSVINNNAGQSFILRNAVVLLSDFELGIADGTVLNVRETATFENVSDEEFELIDDHSIMSVFSSIISLGTIREGGLIEQASLLVGVDHELISVTEESDIFDFDTLYTEAGYYDISLYLEGEGSLQMNKVLRYYVNIPSSRILFDLNDVTKEDRTNFTLQVEVDYFELLKDVVIEETNEEQIISDFMISDEFIKIVE